MFTAYRLYTVVPRLVKFVEQLTNWYVKMNRRRLKGQGGIADCKQALQTLFSVLFSMTKVMVRIFSTSFCHGKVVVTKKKKKKFSVVSDKPNFVAREVKFLRVAAMMHRAKSLVKQKETCQIGVKRWLTPGVHILTTQNVDDERDVEEMDDFLS